MKLIIINNMNKLAVKCIYVSVSTNENIDGERDTHDP